MRTLAMKEPNREDDADGAVENTEEVMASLDVVAKNKLLRSWPIASTRSIGGHVIKIQEINIISTVPSRSPDTTNAFIAGSLVALRIRLVDRRLQRRPTIDLAGAIVELQERRERRKERPRKSVKRARTLD
ncbi:hypothetical protein SDJN02_01202, partial [Cucurbita argyrosperma subsp. argyrosperma]